MTDAGEDEPQVGAFAAHLGEGLEEPRVVLVRPGVRGVEQERARAGGRPGVKRVVVDGEVDRADAFGIERGAARSALRRACSEIVITIRLERTVQP